MTNAEPWHRPVVIFLQVCLAIKILSGLIKPFLPHDLPHRWRENDTYGVAVRYWIRWTTESYQGIKSVLPAILNSGDSYGIMPMEFPLFNLLGAPLTAFGPVWGYGLSHLMTSALNIGLLFYAASFWKGDIRVQEVEKFPMKAACLIMGLFTVAATYVFKFMPDFLSFVMVFIAVSAAWNNQWKFRPLIWAAVGLMIKPTSIVVFAFLLLHAAPVNFLKKHLAWIATATVFAALYYTLGLRGIRSYQDLPDLYAVTLRPPLASLLAFLSEPREIFRLILDKLMFAPGLFLPLLIMPFMPASNRQLAKKILLLLVMQILTIAALDGTHAFVHEYYFIGCTPLLGVLIVNSYLGIIAGSLAHKWQRLILTVGMVSAFATFADRIQFHLRSAIPGMTRHASQFDCLVLKHRHPELPWNQGFSFRSNGNVFPEVGICFHEREGSSVSGFGLYMVGQKIPAGCTPLDQEGAAVVVKCY